MDPAFHVSIMSLKNQQKQNARRSVANDDHWKKTTSLRNRGGKIILLSKNKLAFGSTDFVVFRELGLVSGKRFSTLWSTGSLYLSKLGKFSLL